MIPMDRLSAQTGHLFGEGMDRPAMPPLPSTQRLTKEDLRAMGLLEEEVRPIRESKALARKSDPDTSQKAADGLNFDGKVTHRERSVLLALAQYGAMNWDEIAGRSGLKAASVSPRFKPLREKGLIYDTGETAPGIGGSEQTLWDLTPEGRRFMGLTDEEQLNLLEEG